MLAKPGKPKLKQTKPGKPKDIMLFAFSLPVFEHHLLVYTILNVLFVSAKLKLKPVKPG